MKIETWYSPSENCRVLDVDELLRAMELNPDVLTEVEFDISPWGFTLRCRTSPDAQEVNVQIVTDPIPAR